MQGSAFENVVCEMVAILSRPQCVKVTDGYRTWVYISRKHFLVYQEFAPRSVIGDFYRYDVCIGFDDTGTVFSVRQGGLSERVTHIFEIKIWKKK